MIKVAGANEVGRLNVGVASSGLLFLLISRVSVYTDGPLRRVRFAFLEKREMLTADIEDYSAVPKREGPRSNWKECSRRDCDVCD